MNRPLSTTGTAALLEQLSDLVPDDLINRLLRAPALRGRRPAEPLPADLLPRQLPLDLDDENWASRSNRRNHPVFRTSYPPISEHPP